MTAKFGASDIRKQRERSSSICPRRRKDNVDKPKAPVEIDWNGQLMREVRKDFRFTWHPNIRSRTIDEDDMIRLKHGICITNQDELQDVPPPLESFAESPFFDTLEYWLRDQAWERPFPIQMQGWMVAMAGHDMFAMAPTGSGKTAAYVLPMIVLLTAQEELKPGEGPVGLILVPTRELCQQVQKFVSSVACTVNAVCMSLCGGEERELQTESIIQRVDVVVATPGRLIDFLDAKVTNLRRASFVVVDEADEMLEKSFGEDVHMILRHIRPDRQLLLFSATWTEKVNEFVDKTCRPNTLVHVRVGSRALQACESIEQTFCGPAGINFERHSDVPIQRKGESKLVMLCRLVDRLQKKKEYSKILVFVNERNTVPIVVKELNAAGFECAGIEGFSMKQEARNALISQFSSSERSILVGTDVVGRGLDFDDLGCVINFDMPEEVRKYVHRIGRTGRGGREGLSVTLLEYIDLRFAKELAEILRASKKIVPAFIEKATEASGRKEEPAGKYWAEYLSRRRAARLEADAAAGGAEDGICQIQQLEAEPREFEGDGVEWRGRGRGRVVEFLAACGGAGAARSWPMSPR